MGADIWGDRPKDHLRLSSMSDLKLTASLLSMLERIERHSGTLLMLAITEAGRSALVKHRAAVAEKKGRRRSGDKRVIFRRDRDRYIVFLGDDRIGFVRRADNGTWNHVDTTMAHCGYAKTRERAGQLLRRRYERLVREGEI